MKSSRGEADLGGESRYNSMAVPELLTLMLLRYEHNPMNAARSNARKLHLDAAEDVGADAEDFVEVAMA
jgi:hypothetical protein